MAVENKFKINVIAASVLMGLSLSAMTSAVAADKKEAEVAPAPAKTTLAEVVKAVKPDEVTFDKGDAATNPSQKESLKDLITYLGDNKNTPSHADGVKSVDYAREMLAGKYQTAAAGTDAKATAAALQNLVAFNRATADAMVKLDTAALDSAVKSKQVAATKASNEISAELKKLPDADSKARAAYEAAIADFLKLSPEDQAKQEKQDELKAKLTKEGGPLVSGAVINDIFDNGSDVKGGFKTYDELLAQTNSNPLNNKLASHKALIEKQGELSNALSDITGARENLAGSMKTLAGNMPFFTPEEQKDARGTYLTALKAISKPATNADSQSKAANAGHVTHILGSLNADELNAFDPLTGEYKSVIVNVDDKGNVTGVKDNFTRDDLYTGTQDKPFTTTVLDIRALELGNGALADTNTITVGEAGTKDKKASPVEVWAKTADSAGTPAVKLSENLRTATAQLDENGKPVDGQIVRGADQIHLQNVNIHNSFTLDDKVKMLADDVAALNQQARDKLAAGQSAVVVSEWLQDKNNLLSTKYDGLKVTGLNIDTTTVNPSFDPEKGAFVNKDATKAPADANILLDNLNITLQNDSLNGTSTAIELSGTGNHIQATGGVFDAGKADNLPQANVLDITGANNRVDFIGSTLKGDIRSGAADNTVNLNSGSNLTGDVVAKTGNDFSLNLDGSTWTGGAGSGSPDVGLSNNSVWNVKGYGFTASEDDFPESSVRSLTLHGSNTLNLVNAEGQAQLGGRGFVGSKYGTVLSVARDLVSDGKGVTSVLAGTYSPGNAHRLTNIGLANDGYGGYRFGAINVNGLATGGKYALSVESAGAEPYTIGGRLADGADATRAHEFVSYKTSENRPVTDKDGKTVVQIVKSDADFTSLSAPAELGVYQYAAEKVMDGVNNRTNIYYSSTGKLSNSAATVVSLAAAPVDVANLQSDTLAKHMNSVRHGKDSGVWVSYFGGENRNSTAAGPEYTLKTNGVMLGVDTLTENDWLAGVAVSSARSDMSVMNSSGDLNSYGAQFYMSRRYDSGVFVDSALQFNHFSNTAKARMINGQQAKADFSGNSYGLEAKVGYAWNSEGFFAEPYVRAAARAFDGEHYALSNGMTVNSNDYKSMLGEVGADLGYQYDISGGYVKPYLHLAALNEFADGNSVRVNNVSLDNSVKGAAFQAGLGAEVKMTDNLGGYAAFDYTKGDNTERPWQATVGVNYTW
ncbi:autotransporter outer membrane beta-barrel domain-containing protein [Salmonella enterica]|nr:autotransporter outer membrane beta-barrel domain-containing protein [Salmonella enterica]EGG3527274.1 autotransporter outer membrane beta-barrel domain-containing protein [Salmonella enterica]EHS1218355.1 autotransporter outer membrane beta-barrel domain-containing protein [Salmonella enterica]EHZ2148568.1 autotransporter outer membrane beta-barrel domain-containing protein [Salmonella enterica]EIO2210116.1 autotransporter outer membrane beta-barrel domain-containing protein [Salmonella ent